ncbi:MAG: hypothetical protein U0V74_16690 [Chitinophagales bacterium]
MLALKICPVCGFDSLRKAPYDDHGYPTYEICSCCGYEFGFDDSSRNESFETYRQKWIDQGFKYFNRSKKPKIWNREVLECQLKNISKVNYKPRLL